MSLNVLCVAIGKVIYARLYIISNEHEKSTNILCYP